MFTSLQLNSSVRAYMLLTATRAATHSPLREGFAGNLRTMQARFERQLNGVAGEVQALVAIVRPIIAATLYAVKREVVKEVGGYQSVTLAMLARLYRAGDGDCGLCFEWAVHEALGERNPIVMDRLGTALRRHCQIYGDPASILFGVEKDGSRQVIDTAKSRLTDESLLMYGTAGRPLKLKRHLNLVAAAFNRPAARLALPQSIRGLWKADLFVGDERDDRWVGTSVKINRQQLEAAKGLRIGIVPSSQGTTDAILKDEIRNLIVVPLPHDGSFMQVFYEGWGIVQQFIAADARIPRLAALPRPAHRQVARELEDRRKFPVLDVLDALLPLAQPELLETSEREAMVETDTDIATGAVIAPVARTT